MECTINKRGLLGLGSSVVFRDRCFGFAHTSIKFRPCLVHLQNQKFFKILHHIKSCGTRMEHYIYIRKQKLIAQFACKS